MKKLAILILFLFLCGCITLPADYVKQGAITGQEETADESVTEENTADIESGAVEQEDTFTISEGNYIIFEKKKVTVRELNFNNEMKLSVDNIEMVFSQTKLKEIINGLEINPLEFHFDPTGEDTYVVLQIKKFELAENQYLMHKNQEVQVTGKGKIILTDIFSDDLQSIAVRVVNEHGAKDDRISKSATKEILGVKITNIYPRARAISFEKYAIVQIA